MILRLFLLFFFLLSGSTVFSEEDEDSLESRVEAKFRSLSSDCNEQNQQPFTVEACSNVSSDKSNQNNCTHNKVCTALDKLDKEISAKDHSDGIDEDLHSLDKKLHCRVQRKGSKNLALDFGACRSAINWYDGQKIVNDLALPTTESIVKAKSDLDIQKEFQTDLLKGGKSGQAAMFKAQKTQYEKTAEQFTRLSAAQGLASVAIFAKRSSFPTKEKVIKKWCLNDESDFNGYSMTQSEACALAYAMTKRGGDIASHLFVNTAQRESLFKLGTDLAALAATNALKSKNYKQRAKLVDKVAKTIHDADFNKPENQIIPDPSFCAQNPQLKACQENSGGFIGTGPGMDFDFGPGQNNPNVINEAKVDEDKSGQSNNNLFADDDTSPPDDASNILGDTSGKKVSSRDFNKVGAAKSQAKSGGGGGGGSGGGGGAGAAPGGGGGSAPPKKESSGPDKNFGKKITGNYIKGRVGNFKKGRTIRKKKSKNPFSDLSKNRPTRKLASQIEKEFLPKKVKLFEIISRRYAQVHKSDRLEKDSERFK